MRIEFVAAIEQALAQDPASIFITGDLGYNALEKLSRERADRFLNAGVAEQSMIGIAAGIALTGRTPWVYSIAPFITFRCLEQIRNDLCLHHLPVRLVGNGGGFTYGIMGATHHALEELAALKALPSMTLFFPGTGDQVADAVAEMAKLTTPSYLRLAISGFSAKAAPLWENRRTLTRQYTQGEKLTVIGVGHAIQIALSALPSLGEAGAAVFGVSRFPFAFASDAPLIESVRRTGKILVIEEHYRPGSIAESLSLELPRTPVFEAMTASYSASHRVGSARFLLTQCGLTPEELVRKTREIIA